MLVHLNIGSNRGDRRAHLEQAVALIKHELKPSWCRCSHTVTSEPWGYDSPNHYLNMGVDIEMPLPVEPETLLDRIQSIERAVSPTPHRHADGSYCDRDIDIDIILIDNLKIDTPRLQVPHPRMRQRQFVMQPLQELRTQLKLSEIPD